MDIDSLVNIYIAHEETFQAGDVIIEEGGRDNWVYILLEGTVKVTKQTPIGKLALFTLKKGAVFGEMEFFGSMLEMRCASVIAAENNVRVGVLDAIQLKDDYDSMSQHLRLLMGALIRNLKESHEKVATLITAVHEKIPRGR